ncbi:MAG TPA: carbohydrate-binding protein [Actinomycetota bacterium]|nr:carbohydrate-binding protein [Actinomycetota bacterium]
MRKRIIPSADEANPTSDDKWLDLEELVEVEVTSEDPEYPIESALLPGGTSGWRASGPGEQTIRLLFTQPQAVRRILLEFVEPAVERTQEFVLRWSLDGRTLHDVVRQQWNFSPQGATEQTEDHRVELNDVTMIELTIVPDISGGSARASLATWRLA